MKREYDFDVLDSKIIEALTDNARISMRDLAQYIGMSAPSATERVRRCNTRVYS